MATTVEPKVKCSNILYYKHWYNVYDYWIIKDRFNHMSDIGSCTPLVDMSELYKKYFHIPAYTV